ncbi:MAG: thioredoxin domain-containing protein [Actinocatenispora sp.]
MSSRKRQKQASQRARQQAAALRRRRRVNLTSVLVAVVVLVAGGITAAIYMTQRDVSNVRHYALPTGASRNAPGVPVSHGAVTVDIYLDYMCPHCREFESLAAGPLQQFTESQKISLVYHPLNFLNRFSAGTDYSTRSAAAAGCAADAGKLPDFTTQIFQKQPAENSPGLTNQQLVQVGKAAGIDDPAYAHCVTSQKYSDWVTHVSNEATAHDVHETPTVFVDDKKTEPTATALTNAINGAM